jgi:hypothetical protein
MLKNNPSKKPAWKQAPSLFFDPEDGETYRSSETSVDTQQTTRRYIPEDGTLHVSACPCKLTLPPCSLYKVSHFSLVLYAQLCVRICTVQIVVMEQRANIKFCFKTAQNSHWNFPDDKTGSWWQCSLSYTGFWMVSGRPWKSRRWRTQLTTNSCSNAWHDRNSSWIDFSWPSNGSSDDGRGSIVSFDSKNSSSKTSVSGRRKPVPLVWQRETSHFIINKAGFAKQGIPELNPPPRHILLI